MEFVSVVCALLVFATSGNCDKILVYNLFPFYSHQTAYRPLYRELADRGHKLTIATLNPMENHENITQIDLSFVYKQLETTDYYDLLNSGVQSFHDIVKVFLLIFHTVDMQFEHPEIQELIHGDHTFDLVMTEYLLTIGSVFAHKFQCPLIGTASMDMSIEKHNFIGNPTHPVLYPPVDLGYSGKLNFRQRAGSVAYYFIWKIFCQYVDYRQNMILHKYFTGSPSINQLNSKVDLMFFNSNPIFNVQRPLTGRSINIWGGIHIGQPKPLPKNLQTFLDASNEVIYISFGTSVKSSHLSTPISEILLKVFETLPYTVLWKYEATNTSIKFPNNVYVVNWVPQQDVLRHPNVKLFITQGGLQSLEEAIFNTVPVLVLPFYGDQLLNSIRVVEHGFGLTLNPYELDEANLRGAIDDIMTDNRFKAASRKVSSDWLDRPRTALEETTWWTEYLLRNKNLDLLKYSAPSEIPLYQYYFLDLISCAILFISITIYVIYKLVLGVFKACKSNHHKKVD